ncbi:MAG: helix-turn-helix transcriptional regulator [Bacteroidota bacterium]
MKNHRGQIVRSIIKQSGYSLATLAKRLCVSRTTLYNQFDNQNMSYDFIINVGYIIGFDFSIIFPNILEKQDVKINYYEFASVKDEYISLLEKYNELLALVAKVLVGSNNMYIQKKLARFIEKNITNVY